MSSIGRTIGFTTLAAASAVGMGYASSKDGMKRDSRRTAIFVTYPTTLVALNLALASGLKHPVNMAGSRAFAAIAGVSAAIVGTTYGAAYLGASIAQR